MSRLEICAKPEGFVGPMPLFDRCDAVLARTGARMWFGVGDEIQHFLDAEGYAIDAPEHIPRGGSLTFRPGGPRVWELSTIGRDR